MLDKIKDYYALERWEHIKGMLIFLDLLNSKSFNFSERFKTKLTYAILLHDTGKLFEKQFEKRYYFPIYHAYLSKSIAVHDFGIEDEDILNAILFHPTGRKKMSMLEIFLYLVDFSEVNRKFPEAKISRELILAGQLYKALSFIGEIKMHYIKLNRQPLNINTIKMVKYYEKMV